MKERIIQEIEKTQKRNEKMLKALVPCWTEIDHNRGYIEGLRFDLEQREKEEEGILNAVLEAYMDNTFGGKYSKAFNEGVRCAIERMCKYMEVQEC